MVKGIFIASLDLELFWGVRDSRTVLDYEANLEGTRKAVRGILDVFGAYGVHATWAIVGLIFYKDRESLQKDIPHKIPDYANPELSNYKYIRNADALEPSYHFAPELLDLIRSDKNQEIGTHTFSHYYCLEEGCDLDSFLADVSKAVQVGRNKGLKIRSIVFPRNQVNRKFLPVLEGQGITSFRGNEKTWFYSAVKRENEGRIRRAVRFLDAYLNLSGHNTYGFDFIRLSKPYNIPSSRFLRPVSKKLSLFENLRLRRIKNAMTHAAKHNRVFHIWWHPHNFGVNTSQNLRFLIKVLEHFKILQRKYGMQSLGMGETADMIEAYRA